MTSEKKFPKKWILIRGLNRSRFHWKNFPEYLKAKLQLDTVQALELPGNGYLNLENTPTEITQAVSQLRAQLSFSLEEPIGILGVSLGGMLATAWAQIHPEEISHLVLINSSSMISPFYKRLLINNYFFLIKHMFFSEAEKIEEFILNKTSNNKNKWQPQLSENTKFLRKHPVRLINFFRQLDLAGQVDFRQIPQAEKLILCSKNDHLVSYACSEEIAKAWGSEIYFHDSAGHDIPLDDADWLIDKISQVR